MATLPIGELVASLGLDIKDVKKSLANVEKELKNTEKQTEKSSKNMGDSFGYVTKKVKQLAVAYISIKTVQKTAGLLKDVSLMRARYETLGVVLNTVGKNALYATYELDQNVKSLQKLGISMIQARQGTIKAIQAHIKLADSLKLARIAQDAAVIGNINSSEAFERLLYGIQTAQIEVLKSIGLNVNFENSYKKLAKEIGKTQTELTEAEKLQARLNVVFERGSDIAGTYESAMTTAGKKMNSLTRYIDDFKVSMGKAFQPAVIVLVDSLTETLKELTVQITDPSAQQGMEDFANGIAAIGNAAFKTGQFLAKIVKYAGLRSMTSTFIKGQGLVDKGLINRGDWQRGDLFERQKLLDEALEKQSKEAKGVIDPFITSLTDFLPVSNDFIDAMEEFSESYNKVGGSAREAAAAEKNRQKESKELIERLKELTQIHIKLSQEEPIRIFDTGFDPYGDISLGIREGEKVLKQFMREIEGEYTLLQLKLQEPTKIIDDGFDPYGDVVKGIEEGRRALEEFTKEQELSKNIGNSISEGVKIGLTDGFEEASLYASNLLAGIVQKKLTEVVTSSFSSGIMGGVVGGIAGGVVGAGVGSLLNNVFGGISDIFSGDSKEKEKEKIQKQIISALKENTELTKRQTDYLKSTISPYSESLNDIKEQMILDFNSLMDTMDELEVGSYPKDFNLDIISPQYKQMFNFLYEVDRLIKEGSFKEAADYINSVFEGSGAEALAYSIPYLEDATLSQIRSFIDIVNELDPTLRGTNDVFDAFITNIEKLEVSVQKVKDSIMNTSENLLESAGDAFLSAAEIQKRDFNEAANELITGLIETFMAEGVMGKDARLFADTLIEAGASWDEIAAILLEVTRGTDQYAEVLDLVNNLVETATLNEKARAEALRDSLSSTFNSIYDIYDDLAFRSSGLSKQQFAKSRIEDYKEIFEQTGSLTEDQFSGLTSYVVEWYNAAIQAEEQAAILWKQVADRVEALSNSIQNTIRTVQLGSLNVGLGKEKVSFAAGEYEKLLKAAKTGDESAINEFVGFSQQYLQVAQDTYKSSETYRSIYETVMKDLGDLNKYVTSSDYQSLLYDLSKSELEESKLTNSKLEAIRLQLNGLFWDLINVVETTSGTEYTIPDINISIVFPENLTDPSVNVTGNTGNPPHVELESRKGFIPIADPTPPPEPNKIPKPVTPTPVTPTPVTPTPVTPTPVSIIDIEKERERFNDIASDKIMGLVTSFMAEGILGDQADQYANTIRAAGATFTDLADVLLYVLPAGSSQFEKALETINTLKEIAALPDNDFLNLMSIGNFGLPGYADGGIAYTPQIATLAENGPEVVLDKSKFDRMTDSKSQVLNIYLGNELIDKRILKAIDNNNIVVKRRNGVPGRVYL